MDIVWQEDPITKRHMTSPFDDEDEDQDSAEGGEDLGAVSLDELEMLEQEDVTGHRVMTMNDDGEDPFASGSYYDE